MSMQKAAPKILKLNLFENGVDFIRSAIEDYFLKDTAKPAAQVCSAAHVRGRSVAFEGADSTGSAAARLQSEQEDPEFLRDSVHAAFCG